MALVHQAVDAGRRRPILGGVSLVPGSLVLISLRWLLIVLSALPALAGLHLALTEVARRPYFTAVIGRLPGVHLAQLAQGLPPSLLYLVLATVILALTGQQILVAGALYWLGPRPAEEGPVSPVRTVVREGTARIWTMLRVVVAAAALVLVGGHTIVDLCETLGIHGERAGWTGYTLTTLLPLIKGACIALWLALVGSWAFWCRVVLVADGRRRVRSAGLLVLRVWRRFPVRGALFSLALPSLALALGGALLTLWRQHPPATFGGALAWHVLWLAALIVQAVAWHWLVRAALLLYDSVDLGGLRAEPDAPWGVWQTMARLAWWR